MKLTQDEREDGSNSPIWQQLIPPTSSGCPESDVRIELPDESSSSPKSKINKSANTRWPHFRHSSPASKNLRPSETAAIASAVKSPLATYSLIDRIRPNRWNSRRVRKRVVMKNGECNVVLTNIAKRRRRYLADIFTTMVDIQWRWTILIFMASFTLSWLGFAVIWWLIAFTHGDLEFDHLPDKQGESGWKPCVANVYGFASCFLFSIETQHTIGYGARYTTEECPEGIFVMCIQSIIGVMIQAYMVGVVFSKLTRPKMRAQTLLFSRSATICLRDGQMCLTFRVGDMRKSHIIGASVRAQFINMRVTEEGEQMPYYQHELKVGIDNDESDVFLIWPMTIVHKITPDSPLYHISALDLLKEKFEIVVILEGTIESTSMTTQARSSYLPSEIKWGHRFEPLVSFRKDTGQYAVDYSLFNNTYEVDTPLCSSRDHNEFKKLQEENQPGNNAQTRIAPRPLQTLPVQVPYNRTLLIDSALIGQQRVPSPLAITATGTAGNSSSTNNGLTRPLGSPTT